MSAEHVLVVPRGLVMDERGWHGVRIAGAAAVLAAVARHGRFEPRDAMEHDPRFKQVIPYLVLRDGDRIFLMRRSRAGADERLHDRFSIGVGGHLNPGDQDLAGGLAREWAEEIAAAFVPEFRLLGVLNDDATDVGRVHLGVVYGADAGGRPVAVRETEKLDGRFATFAELRAVRAQMETWSQLVLDFLDAGKATAAGEAASQGKAATAGGAADGRET